MTELIKNKILKIILLILLAIIIVLLSFRCVNDDKNSTQVLEPDYELVQPDDNAASIPNEEPAEAPEVTEGGGSMNLVFSDQVNVDLSTGKVSLHYENPSNSTHSIVVQIIIDRGESQYLVAESGAINPGFMLEEVQMKENLQLATGVYKGYLKLYFFDDVTGERAVVDTKIPADISVQ